MSNNSINLTQAAAVGGMAVAAQAILQPTTLFGWAGAASVAITALGTKIITKATEKITIWYAHQARYLQLLHAQHDQYFETINTVQRTQISKKEEEVLKKHALKYLEKKIGHLLPSDEQLKQEMLDFLSQNFVNQTKFDSEFLGVCMGGSMAAGILFLQSKLNEHPRDLYNKFRKNKKGSVLFHGLHRLTSGEKKDWCPIFVQNAEFFKKPKAFEIHKELSDIKSQVLNRAETFSNGSSDFFEKDITVSLETLNHLALNPIYPWAERILKEFMEKHDGKAAICIIEGRGDAKILWMTFKNSYMGHAVVWYTDSKTCSYFYLDLNGRFRAVFNTDQLANAVLHCIKQNYGGANPTVKEICLLSQS